jgi:hypothetical protein
MSESDIGVHKMVLVVTLKKIGKADYPSLSVPFDLEITEAVCDCALLKWDKPAA